MNHPQTFPSPRFNGWRIALWGAALTLLALPVVAMQLTHEVDWTAGDFLFAAVLLTVLCLGIECAVHIGRTGPHRLALIFAALTAFITTWVNAAVGILGDGPINLAFFAIVVTAVGVAFLARFQPRAMIAIVIALAVAELVVGLVGQLTGPPDWRPVLFMASLWLPTVLLFARASRNKAPV